MKYLCLIYEDEKKLDAMSESEFDAFMGEFFAFTEEIRKSGHFLGGEALQPVQTATTVRVRNGKVSTTDGPFAETKEQLGGFYLISARDLNDAIQVAVEDPVGAARAASRCGRSWSSTRNSRSPAVDERGARDARWSRRSTAPTRAASSPR